MITDGLLFASTSHSRHVQTKRVFTYEHFMFALDLLNLEQYEELYPLMGVNRSGFYNLYHPVRRSFLVQTKQDNVFLDLSAI